MRFIYSNLEFFQRIYFVPQCCPKLWIPQVCPKWVHYPYHPENNVFNALFQTQKAQNIDLKWLEAYRRFGCMKKTRLWAFLSKIKTWSYEVILSEIKKLERKGRTRRGKVTSTVCRIRKHSKRESKKTKIQGILRSSHTFCPLLEWNQVKSSSIPILSPVTLCPGLGEKVKVASNCLWWQQGLLSTRY